MHRVTYITGDVKKSFVQVSLSIRISLLDNISRKSGVLNLCWVKPFTFHAMQLIGLQGLCVSYSLFVNWRAEDMVSASADSPCPRVGIESSAGLEGLGVKLNDLGCTRTGSACDLVLSFMFGVFAVLGSAVAICKWGNWPCDWSWATLGVWGNRSWGWQGATMGWWGNWSRATTGDWGNWHRGWSYGIKGWWGNGPPNGS